MKFYYENFTKTDKNMLFLTIYSYWIELYSMYAPIILIHINIKRHTQHN